MKKLQNNFTTPEQSKRLLELKLPADSADAVYIVYHKGTDEEYYTLNVPLPHQSSIIDIVENGNKDYRNGNVSFEYCWSVGRLMQIFAICFDPDFIEFDIFADGTTFLQQMIDKFETYAKSMDFSKLDE